jgi:hypothetical protein
MPTCCKCNLEIEPTNAVPYLDDYGQPIPGLYRDWCLYHWAHRRGALSPSHPHFFRPLSSATRAKERKWLIQRGHLNVQNMLAPLPGHESKNSFTLSNTRAADILTENVAHRTLMHAKPIETSVTGYLNRIREGEPSMFPGLEELGKRLQGATPEELSDD